MTSKRSGKPRRRRYKVKSSVKPTGFEPRMERLKAIEKDIKGRMEEYALAEERMETGFLCPRDLQCFKIPMTLIPCGVTYILQTLCRSIEGRKLQRSQMSSMQRSC
ncbi:hypothetical protein BC830DRAFT_328958 [Chytriomyces sp. MP71]|nr:hypothetical protein BC830DRAFT_328958 [Chytriomyces sp. MP71]